MVLKISGIQGEMQWRNTVFFKKSALHYWPIATKFITDIAHAQGMKSMEFQKDPWDRRRDTVEKVMCSSSKVSIIMAAATELKRVVAHAQWMIAMEFQKYRWNRWRDTVEKVLVPQLKWPSLLKTTKQKSRRPSFCIAIPALITSLGLVTNTYIYNRDYACGNDFQSRLKTLTRAC